MLDYLADGRMVRPVVLDPVPPTHRQSADASKANVLEVDLLDYDSVGVSVWQVDTDIDTGLVYTSTAVLLSNNMGGVGDEYAYTGKMRIDFAAWGYEGKEELDVYNLVPSDKGGGDEPTVKEFVGVVKGHIAWLDVSLKPMEVAVFEFMP